MGPRRTDAQRIPLPARLRPYGQTSFVGRRRERELLQTLLSAATAGERRAAFVTGEPGIGKSRLVSEFAAHAHTDGALALAGRCDEGLGLAYQPFAEALAHFVDHASHRVLREYVSTYGDTLVRMVPSLIRHVDQPLTEARTWTSTPDQHLLYAAIEELLHSAAEDGPLLLVLEDLHWADTPTILLLKRLITSPRAEPLFVVGTARTAELEEDHPLRALLADLHREPGVSRIELAGLSDRHVLELIEDLARTRSEEVSQRLSATVQMSTGGNPFFITELVLSLSESGALSAAGDETDPAIGLGLSGRLPRSINETVRRRVERLGTRVGHCLITAAVIGDEFDLELVRAVAEAGNVAESLDRAVRAGLLIDVSVGSPRFRFVHALIRRCLYDELGMARRAELHRSVALALEHRIASGRVSAAQLAGHWLAATGAESAKPLRYAALAGDDALATLAPDEARRWYNVALDRLNRQSRPDEAHRCELLIRRGEAERQAGRPEFRETLLEAAALARATDQYDALVRAALANTRGLQSATGVVDDDRIATLEAALAAVGDARIADRARLLALQAAELTFHDRRGCVELSNDAVALARRSGDPATLSMVLALRFVTIWTPDMLGERKANTSEALAASDQLSDPIATFHACHWRGVVCIEAGEISEAQRWIARERELADRLRQPTLLWLATGDEANLAIIEGRFADAERLAAGAFETGHRSEPDAFACYAAQLTALLFEQGELGASVAMIEQALRENPGIPGFRATLALALCDADRLREAERVLGIDSESGFTDLAHDATWLAVVCIFAQVSALLSDRRAAAALRQLLEPWSGMIAFPGWGPWGPVDTYLGGLARVLGDLDSAERHLRRAESTTAGIGAPVWMARTRLGLAQIRRLRGDTAAAHELATEVVSVAERYGARGLARAARLEVRALAEEIV